MAYVSLRKQNNQSKLPSSKGYVPLSQQNKKPTPRSMQPNKNVDLSFLDKVKDGPMSRYTPLSKSKDKNPNQSTPAIPPQIAKRNETISATPQKPLSPVGKIVSSILPSRISKPLIEAGGKVREFINPSQSTQMRTAFEEDPTRSMDEIRERANELDRQMAIIRNDKGEGTMVAVDAVGGTIRRITAKTLDRIAKSTKPDVITDIVKREIPELSDKQGKILGNLLRDIDDPTRIQTILDDAIFANRPTALIDEGARDSVARTLVDLNKPRQVSALLKRATGAPENIVRKYADEAVKTKDVNVARRIVEDLVNDVKKQSVELPPLPKIPKRSVVTSGSESTLADLQNEALKYKSAEEFVDAKMMTPATVEVWKKSKFSDKGWYADVPVIRKEENITLYQGGTGENRQFWTPNKKYAEQFGDVREETGTFYKVDNGNRVTDVYIKAPQLDKAQLTEIYNKATGMTSSQDLLSDSKTPYDTPEIIKARVEAQSIPKTIDINTPEREQLRKEILIKAYGTGALNKNRRLDVVMGIPSAGKSSALAEPLVKKYGSLLADSDEVKKLIPEYRGGKGAMAVHDESAQINAQMMFETAFKNGDNVVYPTVGNNLENLQKFMQRAKDDGYEIFLHFNDLPVEKAVQRAISRFEETGRFVDPDYVMNKVGLNPSKNYDIIKNDEKVSGYIKYSNDVDKGSELRLLEASSEEIRRGSIRRSRDNAELHGDRGSRASEEPISLPPLPKLPAGAKARIRALREGIEDTSTIPVSEAKKRATQAKQTLRQGTEESQEKLEQDMLQVEFLREAVESSPARRLSKYAPKTGENAGTLPEVTGVGKSVFAQRGDDIVKELGFDDTEQAREEFQKYLKEKARLSEMIEEVKKKTKDYRDQQKVLNALRREILNEGIDRKKSIQSARDFFKFSTNEWNRILKRLNFQDPRLMTEKQFDQFMDDLQIEAEATYRALQKRTELKALIFENEFKKVDNLFKANKLPNIENMNMEQIQEMIDVLGMYKPADEFLTVRQLETVKNTDIKDIRTRREALENLAKDAGVSMKEIDDLLMQYDVNSSLNKSKQKKLNESKNPIASFIESFKKGGDRYAFDASLARKNPFYKVMVESKDVAFLQARENILRTKVRLDELMDSARKSRKRSLIDRLAPTDTQIFRWLEEDEIGKLYMAEDMTAEELEAGQYIRNIYAQARDYLVQQEVLKKYRSDYITHIRRGFLEAWKDDGFMAGLKAMFEQYQQDQAIFNILDSKTGQILPLEKFFQFSMQRHDVIKPSQNVSKAVMAYFGAFEKKVALDALIPKIDIYAHSLTPRTMTPRGLEFDDSLKRFVKEWLNTKKGRVIDIKLVSAGGPLDWALRSGMALTRIIDLGLSVPTGVGAMVGEQAVTYVMMGGKNMTVGTTRLNTKKGKEILKRYQNFIGESTFEKVKDTSASTGDKLMAGMFSLFTEGTRLANKQFLLGSLTKEEWKTGIISDKRLAQLRIEMGRFRVVEGAESVLGATSPMKAIGQYKTWAIPVISTTADDLTKVAKALRTDGIKALNMKETRELLRAGMLTATVALTAGAYVSSLQHKKDRSFAEELLFKAYRDAMTLIGVFDTSLWVATPRLLAFIQDLSEALQQIVTLEKYEKSGDGYKKGDLKGPNTLQRNLVPKFIRQFGDVAESIPSGDDTPDTPDLPDLPPLPKLPKKRKLPKRPSI